MEFDLRQEPIGEFWDYDDDREPDMAKRTHFRVIALTPTISAAAWREATPRQNRMDGRYRRQVEVQTPDVGLYQQAIFRMCCTGWENVNDHQGQPIPFTPDTLKAMSLAHTGAVQFVNDIAEMLGRMTVERIQEERERFRGLAEVPGGPRVTGLSPVREDVQPGGS